jgi:hypothetical protein
VGTPKVKMEAAAKKMTEWREQMVLPGRSYYKLKFRVEREVFTRID